MMVGDRICKSEVGKRKTLPSLEEGALLLQIKWLCAFDPNRAPFLFGPASRNRRCSRWTRIGQMSVLGEA